MLSYHVVGLFGEGLRGVALLKESVSLGTNFENLKMYTTSSMPTLLSA